MKIEDLKRVEAAFLELVAPQYHPHGLPAGFAQRVRACAKLPFGNTSDPGAAYEWLLLDSNNHDLLPPFPVPGTGQAAKDTLLDSLAREELREAAWLAAGQHGFAALAGIPELQQLLQRCAISVMDEVSALVQVDLAVSDEEMHGRLCREEGVLLQLLVPQLRLCLLAEVAAGLLVPGHPLPPDTPEHAAALYTFIKAAGQQLLLEVAAHSNLPLMQEVAEADCRQFAEVQQELQLSAPGHELLDVLCQLLDGQQQQQQQGDGGDDGDWVAGTGRSDADVSGSSAGPDVSRILQLRALQMLLQQSQPALLDAACLLRKEHSSSSSNSSSSGSLIGSDVLNGCMELTLDWLESEEVMSEAARPAAAQHLACKGLQCGSATATAASVMHITAEAVSAAAAKQQQQQQQQGPLAPGVPDLPTELLVQQLQLLGGVLVLRFVASARAAGGPAWQGEVPLQVVVLLGALEQLQGLALAGVRQQDVWEAGQAAAAALAAARRYMHGEQQQQQQQRGVPGEGLLLLVQKVTDIIQLTRQFAELNAALNNSSSRNSMSDGTAAAIPCSEAPAASSSSSSSSSGQPLSCEQLFSPGGPVHALHPEPATLGGWSQLAAAATRTASSGAGCADAPWHGQASVDKQQQQPAAAAAGHSADVRSGGAEQAIDAQLHKAALAGALLLFQAQAEALQEPWRQLEGNAVSDWQSSRDSEPADATQWVELFTVTEQVCAQAQRMGLAGSIDLLQLMPAVSFGREELQRLQQQLAQQMQRLGLHPSWHTLRNVGAAAAGGVGSDSSSDSEAGSGHGWGSGWQLWGGSRQQQQHPAQADATAAVKAGGRSVRTLIERMQLQQHQPALAFVQQWHAKAAEQLQQAAHWWEAPQGRSSWMQQQQKQQRTAVEQAGSSSSMLGSMGNRLSWTAQLPSSSRQESTQAGGQQAEAHGNDEVPTAAAPAGSNRTGTVSGCPLCQQDAAAAAGDSVHNIGSQQQQQQADEDFFSWRRLFWALLGRLRPTAQAWYGSHFGMCPHCPEPKLWERLKSSLGGYLWLPPDGSEALWWLSASPPVTHAAAGRSTRLLQYARALNQSFKQDQGGKNESAALLSHQVLLSLAVHHQQLQPHVEVAPLCPSSFVPAVNKLLQQQLGMAQLLQQKVFKAGQPLMWHVWWHIGIRRYHWLQQQQQQPANLQPQQQAGLAPLSAGQLAALYADPAARYYAAGFAARQTAAYGPGLRARAALDAPHTAASTEVSTVLLQGRSQALAGVLISSGCVRDPAVLWQHVLQLSEVISRALENSEQRAAAAAAGRAAFPCLFPPLFQAEGQVRKLVGFCAAEGLMQEAEMVNRSGEAVHIVACCNCFGQAAAAWAQRLELVMQRCDACGARLEHVGGRASDGASTADSVPSCATCGIPRYCSGACQAGDEQHHAALCSYLSAARQGRDGRHTYWQEMSSGRSCRPFQQDCLSQSSGRELLNSTGSSCVRQPGWLQGSTASQRLQEYRSCSSCCSMQHCPCWRS
uniref:MYND-type domain-containing protein n=1 Tax=Tetradesmus obliquus TaxID=3088 RepID=A0A383WHG4_TETOB|eukprot:jgi/Sobl393_1/1245/SZX65452.1